MFIKYTKSFNSVTDYLLVIILPLYFDSIHGLDSSCGQVPRFTQIAGGKPVTSAAQWPWHVVVKTILERQDAVDTTPATLSTTTFLPEYGDIGESGSAVDDILSGSGSYDDYYDSTTDYSYYEEDDTGRGKREVADDVRKEVLGNDKVLTCSGTLINMRYVVTAAHCVQPGNADKKREVKTIEVVAGTNKRLYTLVSEHERNSVKVERVREVFIHKGFLQIDPFGNNWRKQYDIAILTLAAPLVRSPYIQPICLPRTNTILPHASQCIVAGMGRRPNLDRPSPILFASRVVTDSFVHTECDQLVTCLDPQSPGKICRGDSGAPLMCPSESGQWTLQGVASGAFGDGTCETNLNGVFFARASRFLSRFDHKEWVKQ